MTDRYQRIVKGSCWTCRQRRVKCDVQKPTCGRCALTQQSCHYGKSPLKWLEYDCRRRSSTKAVPSSISESSTEVSLSTNRLLPYFLHVVIPRLKASDEPLDLDLHSIDGDVHLQKIVLAVAAAHYTNFTKDISMRSLTKRQSYRLSAIENFRKSLAFETQSEEGTLKMFIVNVLFCILEGVVQPSDQPGASNHHLQGGIAIIERWPQLPDVLIQRQGLLAYSLSIFSTIDLFQSVLGGRSPCLPSTLWTKFGNVNCWWGKVMPGDIFLRTMEVVSSMAVHGHHVKECSTFMLLSTTVDVQNLISTIRRLPGTRELDTLEAEMVSSTRLIDTGWHHFCALYLISARIYQLRVLALLEADHFLVSQQVLAGIDILKDSTWNGMLGHCLIFPLLLIGTHCLKKADQSKVVEYLKPSLEHLSFGNLQIMDDFLRSVWKEIARVGWFETFEDLSKTAFFF